MKVLQVIPSLSPRLGGPTRAVLGLSNHLQEIGADVEILTTDDNTDERLEVPLNQVMDYQGIPTTFLPRTFRAKEFIYSKALSSWHSQNLDSFDVVHTHYLFSYLPSWTARAARHKNIPYIMRPLGQLTSWALTQSASKKKLYAMLLERRNLNQAAAIHCTSQEETLNVQQFGIKTPTVPIPLGVTVPTKIEGAKEKVCQAYDISSDLPIVLFLSRLHRKKQPEVLLNAIAHLLKRQSCHLIFAGSGEPAYVKSLKNLASELNIKDHVTFAGFVTGRDKQLLLQGSDVFALPSHSENFGIAVAEALISGLPIVITPGIQISPEIQAANAGLVVDADDVSFSEALYKMITQHNRRSVWRDNGLRLAKTRYSWTAIAKELSLVYKKVL